MGNATTKDDSFWFLLAHWITKKLRLNSDYLHDVIINECLDVCNNMMVINVHLCLACAADPSSSTGTRRWRITAPLECPVKATEPCNNTSNTFDNSPKLWVCFFSTSGIVQRSRTCLESYRYICTGPTNLCLVITITNRGRTVLQGGGVMKSSTCNDLQLFNRPRFAHAIRKPSVSKDYPYQT